MPSWLLNKTSNLRTSDLKYQRSVAKWFDVLLPLVRPFLYENGGPVIMVQVENEYGSFPACDFKHTSWLRDYVRMHLGSEIVLYTTDGFWSGSGLACGQIDQTLTTVDFGTNIDASDVFNILRSHRAKGPFVNSEFYPGWLDRWLISHQRASTQDVLDSLKNILSANASVNFYMFFGGTSFGLTSGANWENETFLPQTTSYDYDAPMDEAGDPTPKYFAIRDVISNYLPLLSAAEPKAKPKMAIEVPGLKLYRDFFQWLNHKKIKLFMNPTPLPFEKLGAINGFVAYSTVIKYMLPSPSKLVINGIRDRGYVYVDKVSLIVNFLLLFNSSTSSQQFQGIVSRMEKAFALPLRAKKGSELVILVENQGRINFGKYLYDPKVSAK